MTKKIVLIVLGLLALLAGLAVAAGGAAVLAVGGRSGTIRSGYHSVSTPTVAFVSDPAKIRNTTNVSMRGGSATLKLDARDVVKSLFVGVGPSDQVQAYLAGSPYEVVTDLQFGAFRMATSTVPGADTPAAPADQSFWLAQATGNPASLSWPVTNGDYRVVVMNADGSPGVSLDARVGIRVPALFPVGLGTTIGGTLLGLVGLGLLIWGFAAKRKGPAAAPSYPQRGYAYPPAGTTYPPVHPPSSTPPGAPYPDPYPAPPGMYAKPGGYRPPPSADRPAGGFTDPTAPVTPPGAPTSGAPGAGWRPGSGT
jgi:hypothetical protein